MAEKIQINISKRDRSPESRKKESYRDRSPPSNNKEKKSEIATFKDSFEKETTTRGRTKTKKEKSEVIEDEDPGMSEMQKLMGFGGFGTTKNKKVEGNNASGSSKNKKSEYRQYMNRDKGFNRSLSPTPQDKKKQIQK